MKTESLLFLLTGLVLLLLYCKYSSTKLEFPLQHHISKRDNPTWSNNTALNSQDPAFNLTLNSKKKTILLLTSFRGGSTFLGQIFDSNPRVQYLYEPFHEGLVMNLYRRGALIGARPDHTLSDLRMLYLQQIMHNCTVFKTIIVPEQYARCGTLEENLQRFNSTECDETDREPGSDYQEVCAYRHTTVLKVIRLSEVSDLLRIRNIRSADFRIVHLLRNPLPLMKSRRTGMDDFLWDSIKRLEHTITRSNVEENRVKESFESFSHCYNSMKAVAFAEGDSWLKLRYLRVTHKEVSLKPLETAQKIYDFVGEELTDEVKTYMVNITKGNLTTRSEVGKLMKLDGDPLEFRKNSAEIVNSWKNLDWYLKYYDLFNIETQCKRLLSMLGERFSVDSMSTVRLHRLLRLKS